MGFRFRKRIRIAPGIYINIGKKGISGTIKGKGFSVNTGRRGASGTVGIPGTGLSWGGKLKNFRLSNVIILLVVLFFALLLAPLVAV